MLVYISNMRRSLIFALVVVVAAMGPLPLSACTMLTSLADFCQHSTAMQIDSTPGTSHRDRAAIISCHCINSGTPIPQALESATSPAPELVATSPVSSAPISLHWNSQETVTEVEGFYLGAPAKQARLCVFLI